MNPIKFLHCADIHLDAPFTSLGAHPNKASVRRQDLKDAFRKIINVAKEENVNFIVISGDLYEHNYVRRSTIAFLNEKFKEISNIKVFIVPGNHDPYIINSYYKNFSWNENVYIFSDYMSFAEISDKNTRIYGVGFNDFSQRENLLTHLKHIDKRCINILIAHGTVDIDIKDKYNPMTSKELSSLNMDYIALGHFHKRIDAVGDVEYINNPGSPEPLGFDETGEHGVYILEVKKNLDNVSEVSKRFFVINKKTYYNLGVNISDCFSNQEIIDMILESFFDVDKSNYLLSLTLRGFVKKDFGLDTAFIYASLKDDFFFLRIQNETKPSWHFEEISREPGLRGLFVRKMLQKIDEYKEESEKNIIRRALYYGLEALEQGDIRVDGGIF